MVNIVIVTYELNNSFFIVHHYNTKNDASLING